MPRKPSPICRVCGAPREANSKHAFCQRHRTEAQRRQAQKWRHAHPEKMKAIRARDNAKTKAKRAAMPKPAKPVKVRRPAPAAKVRYTPAPQPEIIIGPEAFPRLQPVDVRGHRVTRVAAGVSGVGR
jgi:hypothetical protein